MYILVFYSYMVTQFHGREKRAVSIAIINGCGETMAYTDTLTHFLIANHREPCLDIWQLLVASFDGTTVPVGLRRHDGSPCSRRPGHALGSIPLR